MQHHLYNTSTADTSSSNSSNNHGRESNNSNDNWHNNIWQHRSDTMTRLTSNLLPTLPPVTTTTSTLLQSRYYPSSNTLPSSTSFYQPYPTTTTTSSLPRSSSASAISSSSYLYRQTGVTKPISRPRLTTTLWEDESTLCYQVDSRGICVARRQDNDMINGTKLLNVAGMSRGKRDGILKNERGRIVVKVGAMHLKGVWIPFVRAKALASQFKILDVLYPIFSDDPASFLYPSHFHQLHRYNQQSYGRPDSLYSRTTTDTNSAASSSRGLYYSQQQQQQQEGQSLTSTIAAADHATGPSSSSLFSFIQKRTENDDNQRQ